MLLALDLGNTALKAGLVSEKGTVVWEKRFSHNHCSPFLKILREAAWPRKVTEARLASVVPALTLRVKTALEHSSGVRVKVLKRRDLPVKTDVKRPDEVGMDRLLNGLAAGRLYGKPAVVVDCGTALTFDLVAENGNYAGGIIAPSPELARDYLAEKTALLPRIRLRPPRSVVGKNTVEGMESGLVFGFAALIDGLLERLEREWKPEFLVVGTGGGLKLFLPYLKRKIIFDSNLTLKGIYLVGG